MELTEAEKAAQVAAAVEQVDRLIRRRAAAAARASAEGRELTPSS